MKSAGRLWREPWLFVYVNGSWTKTQKTGRKFVFTRVQSEFWFMKTTPQNLRLLHVICILTYKNLIPKILTGKAGWGSFQLGSKNLSQDVIPKVWNLKGKDLVNRNPQIFHHATETFCYLNHAYLYYLYRTCLWRNGLEIWIISNQSHLPKYPEKYHNKRNKGIV